MSGVVVPVARLVVAVRKDGQCALRMRGIEFRFLPCIVEGVLARIELESVGVLAADAFSARVTAAAISINLRVAVVFAFVLVLFVAAFAFGVVGLGLASTSTMLALLDRTTLGVDVMQLAISMSATAHAVTLDARCTSPFLTVNDRHASRGLRPIAVAAPRPCRSGSRKVRLKWVKLK